MHKQFQKTFAQFFSFSSIFSMALMLFVAPNAFSASIEGKWRTIDEDGKPKAIVQIVRTGNTFTGKIVDLANGVDNNCTVCKQKGALIGRTIVTELKADEDDPNAYEDGKIYDPKNGKTYSSKAKVKGNSLEVRGYLGISLLGRTQVWQRVQ